jgi:predicted metal-dependent hydrolase
MAAQSTESSRAPREIPVRRPAFDFACVRQRNWFGGDVFQSHLLNALSLSFPDGERFFMDSVRHYLNRLESPALRHEVSRFLAQEGMHWRAHEAFNEWVRSLGVETESIVATVRGNLDRARREQSHLEQLAITCALEHFTAILAELMFSTPEFRDQMEPEMRRLWLWHAVEETEHKAVAFDTYLALGGPYLLRAITMLLTSIDFIGNTARFQAHLLKTDPEHRGRFTQLRGFFRLWVLPGYFRPVIPAYLDYYRPGFHPWQRKPKGDYEAIRASLDSLVGDSHSAKGSS